MPVATRRWLALLALVAVLIVAVGRVHIVVNGGRLGLTLCTKDHWSLRDTFVNLKDYLPHDARPPATPEVAIALLRCEVVRDRGDEIDLYWQALRLSAAELGVAVQLEWIGRSLTVVHSDDACERLKSVVIRIAPPGQRTTCEAGTRQIWSIDR
ncbi:MAG: hypothetical protein E6J90_37935 [Deltaproteobacteria bacterium]|nr:MAG: hypothetical protein E6J90_37935 [Deltaproteobacteria bacterium]TMQ18274.1 MAG: hypothetical protein E6J91_08375 [Deltaproteobacteria bacterium]